MQTLTYTWNPVTQAYLHLDRSVLGQFPYKDSAQEYFVRITPKKRTRTIPQNRLYHGYFLKALVKELKDRGIMTDSESLHEELKGRFLTKRVKSKITKNYIKQVFSTTSLSTTEFKSYIERVNEWFMDKMQFSIDLSITEEELLYWESLFL